MTSPKATNQTLILKGYVSRARVVSTVEQARYAWEPLETRLVPDEPGGPADRSDLYTAGAFYTPKSLVEENGVLKLETIENYTPANPEMPGATVQKINDNFAKKVEALKSSMLKAK